MTQTQIVRGVIGLGFVCWLAGLMSSSQQRGGSESLAERCSELGGEWLYRSAELLCYLPDGNKLAYSAAEDGFIAYTGKVAMIAVAEAAADESQPVGSCSPTPSFDDYHTDQSFNGRAKVDFSTNQAARHYRTAITKDVATGVNFAGKYVMSIWGCGDNCQGSAVINAETGKILSYGMTSTGYEFVVDSWLLDAGQMGYFVVEDDAFKQICK